MALICAESAGKNRRCRGAVFPACAGGTGPGYCRRQRAGGNRSARLCRVALFASSSWSYALLKAKHHWIYPGVVSDRSRFDELASANFTLAQSDDGPERGTPASRNS
jgi:hypothetical protein